MYSKPSVHHADDDARSAYGDPMFHASQDGNHACDDSHACDDIMHVMVVMHVMEIMHVMEVMHVMQVMHMMQVMHVMQVMHMMQVMHVMEIVHMMEVMHVMEIMHVAQIYAAMAMGFRSLLSLGLRLRFRLIRAYLHLLVIIRHGSRLLYIRLIWYHDLPPFFHTLQYALIEKRALIPIKWA